MKKILWLIVFLLIVAVGFFFFLKGRGGMPSGGEGENNKAASAAEAALPPLLPDKKDEADPSSLKIYTDKILPISFSYPFAYGVRKIQNDTDTTILVENRAKNDGIQIYITDYSDPEESFTLEAIQEANPDVLFANSTSATLGGAKAFSFLVDDGSTKTREVWAVYKKHFYQLRASISQENVFITLLDGFHFTN